MTVALMIIGGVGVFAAWRLVASDRVSVWVAMGAVEGAAGSAALATGDVSLSPRLAVGWAVAVGAGAAVLLYLATTGFVLVVRRWPIFDRHVAEIYDQRKGLSLPWALLLASGVTAASEEIFWRGLFQGRLASAVGWPAAAVVTWVAYVVANAASGSLPILAGAVVSGAVWGALALGTRGILASLVCHALWTGLMLALPPGGAERSPRRDGTGRSSKGG